MCAGDVRITVFKLKKLQKAVADGLVLADADGLRGKSVYCFIFAQLFFCVPKYACARVCVCVYTCVCTWGETENRRCVMLVLCFLSTQHPIASFLSVTRAVHAALMNCDCLKLRRWSLQSFLWWLTGLYTVARVGICEIQILSVSVVSGLDYHWLIVRTSALTMSTGGMGAHLHRCSNAVQTQNCRQRAWGVVLFPVSQRVC